MTENTKIVVDSYAWIEYFSGTAKGKKVRKYIKGQYQLIVPSIVIAELSNKYSRMGISALWEKEGKPLIELISFIFPLEKELANKAGLIKAKKRSEWKDFGIADAIVAATTEFVGGKILTGDKHLLGKNAIDIN